MGTRAHWFTSRYRATYIDIDGLEYGPTYGDTIGELRDEADRHLDIVTVRVEKRQGGDYVPHKEYDV